MRVCAPDSDHKRNASNGALVAAVAALGVAAFGYIFYSLYDFAVNDREHFDNWNQTMHELQHECPRHWALNMRCCTCKTTHYGHCCARDAWAGYCLLPDCSPENSSTSRAVSVLFAVLTAVLLLAAAAVLLLSTFYTLLSVFAICCAKHCFRGQAPSMTSGSAPGRSSIKVISSEPHPRQAVYSANQVHVHFTDTSADFA